MKTVAVNVDELEGEALDYVRYKLCMELGCHVVAMAGHRTKEMAAVHYGPTVEVPAELVEADND